MKDKELDRLFRQKLEPLEVTPSEEAWQQLESQLQHKKNKKGWFYLSGVAAALLLLLGTWGAFEYSRQLVPAEQMAGSKVGEPKDTAPLAREQETPVQKSVEKTQIAEQASTLAKEVNPSAAIAQAPAAKEQAKQQTAPAQKKEQQQALVTTEEPLQEKEPTSKVVTAVEGMPIQTQALAGNIAIPLIEEALPLQEEVVISYRADEEPEAIAGISQAYTAPEKDKTARKILGFFKKVSDTSGAGLAELREAKNELLSLNRLSRPE